MSVSVLDQQTNLLLEKLLKARNRALMPPPDLTLAEWSEEYMYLSPESSSLPGRFKFHRAEFQREVFDTLSDDQIEKVVIMASSQILKTQALLNYIGYLIHLDPAPILVVQPTSKMALAFSKDRIDTMLRDVPVLKGRVRDKRERDSQNTILMKSFPAGRLSIATAGSPSDLASRPIRVLLCDEVDRYAPGEEGDPISIALARTNTYWNRKIVLVSSPTDESISRIAAEYNQSDRRIFMVPCNDCGALQQLRWEQVKWHPEHPETAHYECEHCRAHWNDNQKNYNVQHGHWERTNPDSKVAGFHISNIYSSFKTLADLATTFLSSKEDPEQLRAFINTQLGECFRTESTTVSNINFLNRLEVYTPDTLPNGIGLITAGTDVQADRLECEIVGWGVGDESWSIAYHVIHGNTNSPAPWEQLAQILDHEYTRKDGLKMRLNAMAIDTGYATQEVFGFSRKYANRNVYAIKGIPGEGKMLFPKRFKRWKTGHRFYPIGVDSGKEKLYSQLTIKEHGPGYCHFHTKLDEYYFKGLTAETYTIKYRRGHPYKVWQKKQGQANEPLDCRIYSMAARYSFSLDFKKRLETLEQKAKEIAQDTPVVAPEVPSVVPESMKPKTLDAQPRRKLLGGMREGSMRDFMSSI